MSRPVSFDIRDAVATDVKSIHLMRTDSGWVEVITFAAYTSGEVYVEDVTFEQAVSGPPGVNQINAIVNARMGQLNARLDDKYPASGPPNALTTKGNGNKP